jgi:probable rRNA maturation factor
MSDGVAVAVQVATGDDEIPSGADWQGWVTAAVRAAELDPRAVGCVTLRLVGRAEGRHLNETYRHKPGATNVLAFPARVDPALPAGERELGDLVICLPVVRDEAAEQGKMPLAHLAHMVVHGTLHLAGFGHAAAAAAARMEALETRILLGLGFPGPYETRSGGPSRSADDEERHSGHERRQF